MNTEKINKLIIISSPSGAGKTTLCKLLLKNENTLYQFLTHQEEKG